MKQYDNASTEVAHTITYSQFRYLMYNLEDAAPLNFTVESTGNSVTLRTTTDSARLAHYVSAVTAPIRTLSDLRPHAN